MMFFLLAFVALVAAFSITNTLITLTIQKTREIGLFKALGFSNRSVTSIFIWMGLTRVWHVEWLGRSCDCIAVSQ